MAFAEKAKADREKLSDSENALADLNKQISSCEKQLRQEGDDLFQARLEAADLFKEKTEDILHRLGLENSRISFRIEPMEAISLSGAASVELWFSANRGETEQPLAEVVVRLAK